MSEIQEEKFKKYVLVDSIKSTAQIYVKTGPDNRDGLRLDTPRRVGLFLQHVFTDKTGKQKKTRFKKGSTSIFMDEQIKADNIPANDKYTEEERNTLLFVNGVLVTSDEYLQTFLDKDNNPQREDFTGRNRGNAGPIFVELDEEALADEENAFLQKMSKALMKIFSMDLVESQSLISLIYGSSYPAPARLKDCQNLCAKACEGDEQTIDLILNDGWGEDSDITVLLGKAINLKVVSFDMKPNFVQIKKGEKWIDSKMIVADSYEQREMLFKQYLASEEGELTKKDIEGIVAAASKPPKPDSKK